MIINDRHDAQRVLDWPGLNAYPKMAGAVRSYFDAPVDDATPGRDEALRAKADSALNDGLDAERRAALKSWVRQHEEKPHG